MKPKSDATTYQDLAKAWNFAHKYGGGWSKFKSYQVAKYPESVNWFKHNSETPISFDTETIEVPSMWNTSTASFDLEKRVAAYRQANNIKEAMLQSKPYSWGKEWLGTPYQYKLQQHYHDYEAYPIKNKWQQKLVNIARERLNIMFMQDLKENPDANSVNIKFNGQPQPIYKTQKVIGLTRAEGAWNPPGVSTPTYNIFPYELPIMLRKLFARPAPTRPRHGFVESREVSSWKEIYELYLEAIAQDPEAELILMEKLSAKHSAVATNAGVSWGRGNDGATAGNGSVFVPAPLGLDTWNKKVAGYYPESIGINNCAYMELVQGDWNMVYLVQRRDGPEPPVTLDYIPKDMKVTKIIKDDGIDLLSWEKQIKSYSADDIKGMVFDNRGGTLASHYAVHAIEHGIAVVCDTKRSLTNGTKLSAFSERPSLTDSDYAKLQKRIKYWWNKDFDLDEDTKMRDQVKTIVGSIHTMSSAWDARPELMELRAMAVTSLARLLTAASFGELRHWSDVGPGNRYDRSTGSYKTDCYKLNTETPNVSSSGRKTAWRKVIKPMSFNEAKKLNKLMATDFDHCGWNSGFGGENWANVATHNYELIRAIQHFQNHPREAAWSAVVLAANKALHTVHNGGVALSKWVDTTQLDNIAEVPVYGFTNPFTAQIVLESAGK